MLKIAEVKTMRSIFVTGLLGLALGGCATAPKPVDPNSDVVTETGFAFRFAMEGEWFAGRQQPDQLVVGKKPGDDKSSTLAIVHTGQMVHDEKKVLSADDILNWFRAQLEQQAQGGRASTVKSKFERKKYKKAECLLFEQSGTDTGPLGQMALTNEGRVCVHPKRKTDYISMTMSLRQPLGKEVPAQFAKDKQRLLDSLSFVGSD